MEFKGTKGPWQQSYFVERHRYDGMPQEWKDRSYRDEALTVRGPGIIGTPECNIVTIASNNYDAVLIAAAPELLEALQEITEHLKAIREYPNDDWFIKKSEKAIKKALGA